MPIPIRVTTVQRLALAVIGILPISLPGQTGSARTPIVAFEHVTVVPMDRERLLPRHTVLVSNGRIAAVGVDGSVSVPKNAVRVDGSGKYLMPGLADMHIHPYNTEQFIDYLAHGVTTVLVLNGFPNVLRWRAQVAAGTLLGPTIYSAGPSLDGVPAGNPTFASIATPESGRAAVRGIAAAGYDVIKMYMSLTPETYAAIVDEAKLQRIAVVGHIPPQVGVDKVIDGGGQVMIAHAEEFFREQVDSSQRDARMADIVRRVKAAGVTVTPNLCVYADYIRSIKNLPAVLAEPEMAYASPAAYSEKLPSHNRSNRPNQAQFQAALERGLARMRVFTRLLSDAGVPLLLGTDTEGFGYAGEIAHRELDELVASGLTPYQALLAGTRVAGEFIIANVRGADRFGTIAPGQRGDLVLLAGNPLESVANTRRIDGVMARGRWMPAAVLAGMRDSLARRFSPLHAQVLRFDSLVTAGRLDDADATLRRLRQEDVPGPPISQIVMWVKAQRLLPTNLRGAVRLLEWNASMYPDSHSSHTELARGYLAIGDSVRAAAEARRALKFFPQHETARVVLRQLSVSETGGAAGARPSIDSNR